MPVVAMQNVRSRQEWAEIINADWRKSIESIIQTGRDLAAAKAELPHGEFGRMVADDLPFSARTAEKLIAVSSHPAIANPTPASHLPPSWAVLSELTALSAEDFTDAQAKGIIGDSISKRAARAVTGAYNTPEGETWGAGKSPASLPSPSEASRIARATNRMVAASDGNVYSGATEEEGDDHIRRRQQTYGIIDAVNTLSDCPVDAFAWIDQAEAHWLHKFHIGSIDDAIEWLTTLRVALKDARGVVDAE